MTMILPFRLKELQVAHREGILIKHLKHYDIVDLMDTAAEYYRQRDKDIEIARGIGAMLWRTADGIEMPDSLVKYGWNQQKSPPPYLIRPVRMRHVSFRPTTDDMPEPTAMSERREYSLIANDPRDYRPIYEEKR